jgi:alpha-L-arabinofuranosidase
VYIKHVQEVAAALRAVAPDCQIGIGITDDQRWGNTILKQAAGSYDFVASHYYAVSNVMRRQFEPVVLSENYKTLDRTLQVNALLKEYNPGRKVYQLDTEWGMISSGANGEVSDNVDRNANITGVVHRAVRLIYYAREGMLRGASSWQMLNRLEAQGFGVLFQQAPEKRAMLYWLYYYFNRSLGERALKLDGTAPYYTPTKETDAQLAGSYAGPVTPALVTLSQDRKTMYVMIANGSWTQTVPCKLSWKGFNAAGAEGVLLTSSDRDAKPLLERKEDFVQPLAVETTATTMSYQVPPHSVSFITLKAK